MVNVNHNCILHNMVSLVIIDGLSVRLTLRMHTCHKLSVGSTHGFKFCNSVADFLPPSVVKQVSPGILKRKAFGFDLIPICFHMSCC